MPATLFPPLPGQDELKLALLLTAVDPLIGGLLAFGDRGTGKSTAVRALAALLPEIRATSCAYHCDPDSPSAQCADCRKATTHKIRKIPIPVVDLPLGATEDRVLGALNLERALSHGEKHFEPGLLAQANRGYLYVDEVNLLEDHIVDLLLDVAASGENVVEREGLSVRHPARIVLVGSGNPEEGELRPQLLDRFGLSVEVRTPTEVATWVEIVKRRDAFERDHDGFTALWAKDEDATRRRIVKARKELNGGRCAGRDPGARRGPLHQPQDRWPARPADPHARRPRACRLRGCQARHRRSPEAHGSTLAPPPPAPQPAGRDGLLGPHQPRGHGSAGRVSPEDAATALALLALDGEALKGAVLKGPGGPARDGWIATFRDLLRERRFFRVPPHVGTDRLTGSIDVAATLRTGTPRHDKGLIAEADGGILLLTSAERLGADKAALLAAAMDEGHSRFSIIACDEGIEDERLPVDTVGALGLPHRLLGLRCSTGA